jgi:hypothetical protein
MMDTYWDVLFILALFAVWLAYGVVCAEGRDQG